MNARNGSAIGVDVGGTFTDVVAVDRDGNIRLAKVPTTLKMSHAPVLEGAAAVDAASASVFNLASTMGLNAVITRDLPKVGFLTTAGHRDMLDAGSIARPAEALTDPRWRRSFGDANRPLVPRYLRRGVHERITSKGEVFIPFDAEQAREEIRLLRRCGVEGIAICLINSYVNPEHERRLKALVREELGDIACSVSSEINPVAREYPRAMTAVIDLLMKLKYDDYTNRLIAGLADLGFRGEFNYADCRAMLMPHAYAMRRPYRLIVGGPAAGAVASAHFGSIIDDGNLICADVGGTSTDISVVINGRPFENTAFELEPDLNISALSIDVVTLGAGGGSVVGISPTGDVLVGPGSAGADPGPAAYGRGGKHPTTSDTALLAGILAPGAFLGGRMALQPELSLAAFESLDTPMPLRDRVRQAWAVAVNNIAEGILNISIRRGVDPRDFSLIAYGAAGPMLLPPVLDALDMRRVIIPPHPGLFSALGLVSSDLAFMDQRSAYLGLEEANAGKIDEIYRTIEQALSEQLSQHEGRVRIMRSFDAQLIGQSFVTPLIEAPNGPIDADAIRRMRHAFHEAYELRSGNRFESHPVEGVTYRVQAVVPMEKVRYPALAPRPPNAPLREIATQTLSHIYGDDIEAKVYARIDLRAGDTIDGPAIVREDTSTTLAPPGRALRVGRFGELVIT